VIKFKTAPVEGQFVRATRAMELFQGQEVRSGDVGVVRYVFDDTVTVRFDVVSDRTGAEYTDSVSVEIHELPESFEEFADFEVVDDE
jgi:hypothetical protein